MAWAMYRRVVMRSRGPTLTLLSREKATGKSSSSPWEAASTASSSARCISPMFTIRRLMPRLSHTSLLSAMSFCLPSGIMTP